MAEYWQVFLLIVNMGIDSTFSTSLLAYCEYGHRFDLQHAISCKKALREKCLYSEYEYGDLQSKSQYSV